MAPNGGGSRFRSAIFDQYLAISQKLQDRDTVTYYKMLIGTRMCYKDSTLVLLPVILSDPNYPSFVRFCSLTVFDPRLATPWTYFLHLSLSSVILIDSSTESPVHVLMVCQRQWRLVAFSCLRDE